MTRRARILGLGVLLILVSAVAAGAWSHLAQYRLVKHVADQQRAVGRRGMRTEFFDICTKGREAKPSAFVVEQVERRGHHALHAARHRRQRDAAVARHHRGHPLAHFRRHLAGGQHQPVIMRVRVDEARCRNFPGRVHLDFGLGPIEPADSRDAVCTHADIPIEARHAAAVDDACVPDQQIELFHSPLPGVRTR